MHLTGNRRHSVDAKLRLKLPADFRREFEGQVCLLPLNGTLYGFTPEGHAEFVAGFFPGGFNPRDREQEARRRLLNASTVTVDIDSAGRICLGKVPERYLPQLGDSRQVVVVGNEGHFEVWSEDAWRKEEERMMDELDRLLYE